MGPEASIVVTSSRLLNLPTEIRLAILTLLLAAPDKVFRCFSYDREKGAERGNGQCSIEHGKKKDCYEISGLQPQVLRACRMIQAEACPILYGTNTFVLLSEKLSLGCFLKKIGRSNVSFIRKLAIMCKDFRSRDTSLLSRTIIEKEMQLVNNIFNGYPQLCNLELFGVALMGIDHIVDWFLDWAKNPTSKSSLALDKLGVTNHDMNSLLHDEFDIDDPPWPGSGGPATKRLQMAIFKTCVLRATASVRKHISNVHHSYELETDTCRSIFFSRAASEFLSLADQLDGLWEGLDDFFESSCWWRPDKDNEDDEAAGVEGWSYLDIEGDQNDGSVDGEEHSDLDDGKEDGDGGENKSDCRDETDGDDSGDEDNHESSDDESQRTDSAYTPYLLAKNIQVSGSSFSF